MAAPIPLGEGGGTGTHDYWGYTRRIRRHVKHILSARHLLHDSTVALSGPCTQSCLVIRCSNFRHLCGATYPYKRLRLLGMLA